MDAGIACELITAGALSIGVSVRVCIGCGKSGCRRGCALMCVLYAVNCVVHMDFVRENLFRSNVEVVQVHVFFL